MDVADVAPALQARLGSEGTAGLLALFETARQEWTVDVTTAAVERFERRLTDEISSTRVALAQTAAALREQLAQTEGSFREQLAQTAGAFREQLAQSDASLRHELARTETALRKEIVEGDAGLRQEMGALAAAFRKELSDQGIALRHEISALRQEQHASRFELVKWSFAFWVAQVFAVAGIVGVMLRLTIGSGG
jgi:hypothetical protein